MMRSWFACVLWGLAAVAGPLAAQSPAPLPSPNPGFFAAGTVYAVARLSDGSVVVGGHFDYVNQTRRRNLAKFLADGSLDASWAPEADSVVFAIVVDASDSVFIGGQFATVSGQPRFRLAKLAGGSGSVDAAWTPTTVHTVRALALDGAGGLIAGGSLGLQKFSAGGNGAQAASWNPQVDGVLALHRNGAALYVGGTFASVGGMPQNRLARVDALGAGARDATWMPEPDSHVLAIDTDAGGAVFVGGAFLNIGGQSRSHLAKLSSVGNGAADLSWNPAPNGTSIDALRVDGASIYAAGSFGAIGGASRVAVAKLSTTGTGAADAGWDGGSSGFVLAYAIDRAGAGGQVYVGGSFDTFATHQRLSFVTLSGGSGALQAPNQDIQLPGTVRAILRQANGGTIVGGTFRRAGGVPRTHLARLLADGTVDATWNPVLAPAGTVAVNALAENAAGDVYIAARDGNGEDFVAKHSGSGAGAADATFVRRTADDDVLALAIKDNLLYAGGAFTFLGATRARGAALDATTGVPTAWDAGANNTVRALAVDATGNVYLGGDFTMLTGAVSRGGLAKMSAAGSVVAGWNAATTAGTKVYALRVDGSALYVGGTLAQFNGTGRSGLARVATADGALDMAWNPSLSAPNLVRAIVLDGNRALFAGGDFTDAGGATVRRLARVAIAGAGAVDAKFVPTPDTPVQALALGAGTVYAGGDFALSGTAPRAAFAAYAAPLFEDGFE